MPGSDYTVFLPFKMVTVSDSRNNADCTLDPNQSLPVFMTLRDLHRWLERRCQGSISGLTLLLSAPLGQNHKHIVEVVKLGEKRPKMSDMQVFLPSAWHTPWNKKSNCQAWHSFLFHRQLLGMILCSLIPACYCPSSSSYLHLTWHGRSIRPQFLNPF